MSFSSDVKEELLKQKTTARHCQIAELAAILTYSGAVKNKNHIEISMDSPYVPRKCLSLLEQILEIKDDTDLKTNYMIEKNFSNEDTKSGQLYMLNYSNCEKILQTTKISNEDAVVNAIVIKSLCCKRAFLRGAFLSIGSMSNPEKGYHLEFVCENIEQANQILENLRVFEIEAKIVARKRYQIVYIKESEGIVELLNVIGAHVALMNLENLRILKDMRNSINRRVNCEAANITKTVNAASKQIEDIEYIKEHFGFDNLSDNLKEIAKARLEYPDATLKELGERMIPTVGKSGVNHRLRKLSELADKIRG